MTWKQDPKNRQKDREANKRHDKKPERKAKHNARKGFRRALCGYHKKLLNLEEMDRIYKIYAECQFLTEVTGIKHHVDHIMPLAKGGLHHPDNLQILTAEENLKKGVKVFLDGMYKNCQIFRDNCQ
jgi:5-methylcytosine-specific restriction endonuclease McrA